MTAIAIILFILSISLFAAVAFAGYDILWPVKRPTPHEKRLYLEQDVLIDKYVESNPLLTLWWRPGGYDGQEVKTSAAFMAKFKAEHPELFDK